MVYADNRIAEFLRGDMIDIYIIGANNGLRVSDVLNLRVKAVRKRLPTIKEIKTGKSKRIYIPVEIARRLAARADERGDSDNDYIFKSPSNPDKPMTRQAVWKAFKKAEDEVFKKYGDKVNVGTHSMRKSYARKLLRKGKSYKEIQVRLNHAQLGDSLRYLIDGGKE